MNLLEKYYGKVLHTSFKIMNPFKKIIINTHCKVHIFINMQALSILRVNHYMKEYKFFSKHIRSINEGVVWADQDFKSNGHFYHPYKKKGLYGGNNALNLAKNYYNKSIYFWNIANVNKSMFYLGACMHIIQDMTISQHANIKLLDNHKQFETFVKKHHDSIKEFICNKKPIMLSSIDKFIRFNARFSLKMNIKFKKIKNTQEKFYKISKNSLPLAQRTTAGCMIFFYINVVQKINPD
ncbi:MAG: zinc dependent phospholipase C family protein [Tepidibacter sp.]|uniref:zinc dependent phospholipase C family protein n=1 Tax=Tepidibacter sp. TaxID=2529387 RepID=UPI0025F6C3E8|nr:zinc dependent phospholipase C family protein [Tepidibacter sp.]MCT4508596.1 zinc dependent phospholipase C family protein [Tepidibacter sp.]